MEEQSGLRTINQIGHVPKHTVDELINQNRATAKSEPTRRTASIEVIHSQLLDLITYELGDLPKCKEREKKHNEKEKHHSSGKEARESLEKNDDDGYDKLAESPVGKSGGGLKHF